MLLCLWNEFDGVDPIYNWEWLLDKIKAKLSFGPHCVIRASLFYYFFYTRIFWRSPLSESQNNLLRDLLDYWPTLYLGLACFHDCFYHHMPHSVWHPEFFKSYFFLFWSLSSRTYKCLPLSFSASACLKQNYPLPETWITRLFHIRSWILAF